MLRRLILVAFTALALASPASAFSKQDETQTMDDGVSIALTRYTPVGLMPSGGWPGVSFGLPCLSATRAAIAVRSNTVRIVIPRKR